MLERFKPHVFVSTSDSDKMCVYQYISSYIVFYLYQQLALYFCLNEVYEWMLTNIYYIILSHVVSGIPQ